MTNGDLAQQAREIAGDCMARRRAALVASVALEETRTIDAARTIVAELTDRPLAAAALAVLDELARLKGSQP